MHGEDPSRLRRSSFAVVTVLTVGALAVLKLSGFDTLARLARNWRPRRTWGPCIVRTPQESTRWPERVLPGAGCSPARVYIV
jgi:hypothetical protein